MAAIPAPLPAPAAGIEVPWSNVERFVGLFTHDLRNGLNAVELQLTLLSEISDDPAVKDEVKRVRASVADITRQLHTARVATAPPTPHLFQYPALDFVEDLRERFERQSPDVSARVDWHIETGATTLFIDPELSMTALLELVANALLYAAVDSRIKFGASKTVDGVTFLIQQDFGDLLAGSADAWGQTPLSSSRRDGYGLGAFRARRIIEAQKGSLQFAYSEADQSLTTTVVLPVAVAASAVG